MILRTVFSPEEIRSICRVLIKFGAIAGDQDGEETNFNGTLRESNRGTAACGVSRSFALLLATAWISLLRGGENGTARVLSAKDRSV